MQWATIVPVLVGSGVALISTVLVEFLRNRQTVQAARRERDEALRRQSRMDLHTLLSQVQDSLQAVIALAGKIVNYGGHTEEGLEALRDQFRSASLDSWRLISRLPYESWRNAVKELIELSNGACAAAGESSEEALRILNEATQRYEVVIPRIAEPMQKFYKIGVLEAGVVEHDS